ncbi:MAG: hypothetical protein GC205_08645 [Bacteroidetes bacterium]|nr:hypothetical protein [Bacteroidota bacterium]
MIDFDPEWIAVLKKVQERFGKKPDLQALLFLIGLQELGQVLEKVSKEQKQDLMHIAVCRLLSEQKLYRYIGRDDEGWPHYEATAALPQLSVDEQERMLKRQVIRYFADL